ncbi:methionine aminotransferase [Faecalibacter rhinopitheci]|uniref:Aminotransferase class I/II-fold pyridoxal phosphate-dependent enzyme n=1 Tax=Faecalibacter rhinopitheci TaxID=2779678 RepID=A0A8J7FNR0_9FLAO|nr:methionine aminotransferase [Faecalibacter rhinopitheci]MBF0597862.1 aminotransferase class I/II-fold pyridoxal phosphate-dependent enzyme [Faecalibacter rhinopitheci]
MNSKLPHLETTIFTVMSKLANQHQAINLAQGFPDFDPHSSLIESLNYYSYQNYNQYAPMIGVEKLRNFISEKTERFHHTIYHPEQEITITNGASQAIFTAIAAVIEKGDEVIIFEPAYDLYKPAVEMFGGIVKPIQLTYPDYNIDYESLKSKVTSQTKLIIFNNPNNPSGKIFKAEDLVQIEAILKDKNCYIISDEVYEHMTFDAYEHQSFARIPSLKDRTFITASFGKLCHVTGWKVGYVLAGKELMNEFRKVHQYNVFSVHTPSQYAIADYLDDENNYLELNNFFQEKRDYFTKGLSSTKFELIPAEGTYFVSASFKNYSELSDREFAKKLTIENKVATIPFSAFYHDTFDEKVIRFCFAKQKETLDSALEKLNKL